MFVVSCLCKTSKELCRMNIISFEKKSKKYNFPLPLSPVDRPKCYINITTKKWLEKGNTSPGKSGGRFVIYSSLTF